MANQSGNDDGEGTELKTLRELGGRRGDNVVQYYSADGHLYAYREGDEHIVVSNGREPADDWTTRVPAERTAVTTGEHLWTIPENWEQRVKIKGNAEARYAIYHIPESDVDVQVTVPHNNHLVDAWFGVQSVGQKTFEYADSWDFDELDRALENYGEEMDEDVCEDLERIARHGPLFERKFGNRVEEHAPEAIDEQQSYGPLSLDGWTFNPWGEHPFDPDGAVLADAINREEVADVKESIDRIGSVIPRYPDVRVTIDSSDPLPEGFAFRALIEAGCSPSEAIDYYFVEEEGISQTEWANIRGCNQSTISGNVGDAEGVFSR